MLHPEIASELDIYNKLAGTGRSDLVAQIVKEKILQNINRLSHEQTKQNTHPRRGPYGFIRYVLKIMYRIRNLKNGWHCAISPVSECATETRQAETQEIAK